MASSIQEMKLMKHHLTALSIAVLVLALTAFTGAAFAGGNGNGNGNAGGNGNSATAPGHQDQAAPAPAVQHESKQSSTSASNPATGGSNTHGVKPSNSTKHDTYAKASSDQTKQYGNGKTAGQIATQAGYGDATLHGPGNSQPHKTAPCPGSKHEVDVHALKNKKNTCGASTPSTPAAATPQASSSQSSTCTTTTRTSTEQVPVVLHKTGNGKYVRIHPNTHSEHYSKHTGDIAGFETVTKTESVPTGANCETTKATVISTQVTGGPTAPASTGTPATATASATAAVTATATPAPTATPVVAGGVKGAVVTLKPTKTKPAGGVLGTTTRLGGTVASTKLPFTGLSLWIFLLVAAGLIAIGATMRRSAAREGI
jgi:hypothetical protein